MRSAARRGQHHGNNSLEKMLSHQLAVLPALTLRTGQRALKYADQTHYSREDSVELARLTNASARASAAYTEGMLALQRMRQGGSQGRSARSSNLVPAAQESVGLDVVLVENACASVRWSAKFARVTKGQYVYA